MSDRLTDVCHMIVKYLLVDPLISWCQNLGEESLFLGSLDLNCRKFCHVRALCRVCQKIKKVPASHQQYPGAL